MTSATAGRDKDDGVTPMSRADLPSYSDLIYPTLRAVEELGGSAQGREITDQVAADIGATEEQLEVTYENRPKSILVDRMEWARSYATLGGALERPKRGLFVLTPYGRAILALSDDEGRARVRDLDRQVKAAAPARRRTSGPKAKTASPSDPELGPGEDELAVESEEQTWKETLLNRLHGLTPTGFEECHILRSRLVIDQSLSDTGTLHLGPTKTYSRREVILPPFLRDMMAEHLGREVEDRADAFVFTTHTGTPLRNSNFRRVTWDPALRATGLGPLRIHDMRHTCAAH
jgi:hypothetical protein